MTVHKLFVERLGERCVEGDTTLFIVFSAARASYPLTLFILSNIKIDLSFYCFISAKISVGIFLSEIHIPVGFASVGHVVRDMPTSRDQNSVPEFIQCS